jgi:hypothetical protein
MAAPAQAVIYRLDDAHKPIWQYHSMPESAVGGANTLDEAREQYRDALRFLLDTDELPKIREYVEREAHLGIWVRTRIEDPNADGILAEIAGQISQYPREDLDWFYRSATAGGDPVVFYGLPDDPLFSIFDQMTPFDSLILMAGLGRHPGGSRPAKLMWLVVEGLEAKREDTDQVPIGLNEFGLTPESPLKEVFAAALRHHERFKDLQDEANKPLALLAAV